MLRVVSVCVCLYTCVCVRDHIQEMSTVFRKRVYFFYIYIQTGNNETCKKKNTKKTTMNFVFKCCKHSNAYAHFDFICFVLIQLDS